MRATSLQYYLSAGAAPCGFIASTSHADPLPSSATYRPLHPSPCTVKTNDETEKL
jgi:hypothetical protein